MRRQAMAVLLAAGVGTLMAGIVDAPSVLAVRGLNDAPWGNVPNVYNGDILFALSGLDGKTNVAEACIAATAADELAIRFHLPRDPVLKIQLPGDRAAEWRLVTNDILVGKVPGDETLMVVGFASAHVVVGRLPPGAHVNLEGGDATVILLRGEIGDRTRFSFAYDPKGQNEAIAAAADGLKVSIDTLIETRLDFFQKAPKPPEGLTPLQARALAKAFSVMKVNIYAPEDPIKVRWTTSARWPDQYMGLWPSAFHSLGLMHLNVRLAKESLQAVYGFQGEDGFIPHRMGPGQTSEISHPPILGWAAWQVYVVDRMQDREFLERSFDVAQKHVLWYLKKRRLDGEPPPTQPLEYGAPLYFWKSAEESGAENSPRFADGAQFAAIDLSCYLVNECSTLQTMAQRLGYRELAKTWGRRSEAIAAAASTHLWDAERGFFFDRKGPGGPWIDVWTSAGLLPLWSGLATPQQATRLKEHLLSSKFWTALPVPTVASGDPKFKKDMWCGPTWAPVNYLIYRGLQRYGYPKEAADLRARTIEAIARWYEKTGVFHEYYDPDDQTPPVQLARKSLPATAPGQPVIADYHATASVYADLVLRPTP